MMRSASPILVVCMLTVPAGAQAAHGSDRRAPSGTPLAVAAALPSSGARIEAIAPAAGLAAGAKRENHKEKYSLKLEQAGWLDTGIPVHAGDTLIFSSEGTIHLTDGRSVDPDGVNHGWRDMLRQLAMADANTGALVGRIGDSPAAVPFVIGRSSQTVAHQSGHLYLRANTPESLFSSGEYKVSVKFTESVKPVRTTAERGIAAVLPVDMFAQIPRRVEDADHNPGDVVNFALVGTEEQVRAAFANAGWVTVDKSVDEAIVNGLFATLERKPYLAVPMSTLYLFGRPQDMSYARADAIRVAAVRHHLRVWRTTFTVHGVPLWVGSATHDVGFERDERNGGITHRIDEKIDAERDFIRASFEGAGVVASAAYVTPADPVREAKTATGGSFETDGRILVLDLQ